MKNTIIAACVALFFIPAQGGVYKCTIGGKVVYSDAKCDADSTAMQGLGSRADAATDSGPIAAGKQTCKTAIPTAVVFQDPSSIQIGTIGGGSMEVMDYAGKKVSTRVFTVPVNAKNSYGAYMGAKPVTCYTSEDGRRLLKMDDALLGN